MNGLKTHLQKLSRIKRHVYHPLIHRIHKKHRISKKTLFYVKEYGSHANAARTIIRESLKILLLASIISSFGGFALERIKLLFVSIVPLVIILPALNGSIGNYGCVVASRFSTMLHEGKIKEKWWLDTDLRKLFFQVILVSFITSFVGIVSAITISAAAGYPITGDLAWKVIFMVVLDMLLLVSLVFGISIGAGIYFYRKKEDPNNFLIPITTSVADFGNMIILSALVLLLF